MITKRYWFGEAGSNPKLAEYGAKNHMSCGGEYIFGHHFIVAIFFAADSYNHATSVEVWKAENEMDKEWHETDRDFKRHMMGRVIAPTRICLSPLNEFLESIGVTP